MVYTVPVNAGILSPSMPVGPAAYARAVTQPTTMKLENCELDVDRVAAAPMERTEPEPDWIAARDARILPAAGFAMYSRSRFLSFGAAPRFLADERRFLFSYFAMVLRSVRDALVDADVELRAFSESQARVYDPGKRMRGEEWDPTAADRARKHFRLLLLSLQAGLDASADLTALFLTGLIPGLRLGRAQFSRIESWLERPLPPGGLIVTPQRACLERLYVDLSPLVNAAQPERDWLPLMRMFRNKAAHLGDAVFRYIVLHDRDGRFYTFIPRQWPFIPEEHVHPAGVGARRASESLPELLRRTLVHEDIVSYASGLRAKLTDVIAAALEVLDSAYVQFRDFPPNAAALAELEGSSAGYAFEHFRQ